MPRYRTTSMAWSVALIDPQYGESPRVTMATARVSGSIEMGR